MAEMIRPGRQSCPAEAELRVDYHPVHFIESSTGFPSRSTFTRSVSPGLRVSSILMTFTISAFEVTGIS